MAMVAERFAFVPPLSETRSLLSNNPPRDFDSLRRVLLSRAEGGGDELPALRTSILAFEESMQQSSGSSPRFDFFTDVLPYIHSWALASCVELPILRAGSSSQSSLSRGIIRTLLSNAFFLNVIPFQNARARGHISRSPPTGNQTGGTPITTYDRMPRLGNISFMWLYKSTDGLAVERLLCILAYFAIARDFQPHELEEKVCFERHTCPESDLPVWETLNLRINASAIHIHTGIMENSDARCIMDFANKALHIHEILPSATQEEILFSTCPEAFPGILFCDVLMDTEVIIIRNVRRYVQYKGYAYMFKFEGLYSAVRVHDIIVADATYIMHFTKDMNDRDLNKAYLAFRAASATSSSLMFSKISTSHWGCGAFCGDKHYKFLQQVCASTLAGVQLDYSTFQDEQIAVSFREMLELISSRHHTIASVYHAMSGYERERGAFSDYVLRNLNS